MIVAFLWRDLNLTDRSDIPLPDIIVENIEIIDWEINGAQWKLISPRVEHRDGFFYGDSLDITITEKRRQDHEDQCDKGVFTRSSIRYRNDDADAVMTEKGKVYDLSAAEVEFKADDGALEFFQRSGRLLTAGSGEGSEGTYDSRSERMYSDRRRSP
jgi:hypothetical protein